MGSLNISTRRLALALLFIAGWLSGCATASSNSVTVEKQDGTTEAYARAIEASHSGDNDTAEAALLSFLGEYPEVAEGHASLGMLYAQSHRDEQAAASLAVALQHNPNLPAAHNEMGMVHRRAGRFEQARQAYQSALDIDASHANAHRNLGVLYDLYLGKPALALPHYQQYRSLVGADDPLVAKWVTDLQRRIDQDTKTARVNN